MFIKKHVIVPNCKLPKCPSPSGVIYSQSEMLYSNENERSVITCNSMDESYRYNVESKRPNKKEYILYDPNDIKCTSREN